MKVLMVTPYLPYPLYSGGQVRLYNLIKNLSSKHEISLFSFIRHEDERKWVAELSKYCQKVEVFKKRKPWDPETLFRTAVSPYPLLMTMYDFPQVRKKLQEEIKAQSYDLIHVECFYAMQNLPKVDLPLVLAEQNVEYLVYQRFVQNFRFWIFRPLMYLDVLKIKFWEKHFWQKAKVLVAVSKEEKKLMGLSGVEIVPNGADVKYFEEWVAKKDSHPTVVFVGNFRWIQNKDALRFLYAEIWPKVKDKIPEAKLLVVGRDMPKGLKDDLGDDVVLEEKMEDVRQAYQRADLLLSPVRVGGGTSFKVLEAMTSSLPVVTTPLGIEGIEARDGQEVIVRQSPRELAEAVVKLLRDEKARKEMGAKAQKLMEEKYDWGKISAKLSRVWEEAGSSK